MTKIELMNEIRTRNLNIAQVMDTIKAEARELSNVEKINIESWKAEARELEAQVKDAEKAEILQSVNVKSNEKFSLLRTIRNIAEGKQIESSELLERGKSEFRKAGLAYNGQVVLPSEFRVAGDIVTNIQYQGQEAVAEDKWGLLGALRAESVLAKAGAQIIGGLVGDISIPIYAGSSVNWATETGTSTNGGSTFSEVTMSPKRLTAYIDISKKFLLQDSVGAEQLLMKDLQEAIIVKLENTIFGTAAGSTTQPAGLFYSPSYTSTGTTTWANTVALESAVATNNALVGNMAYIVHPTTNGVFKTTPKATNAAVFVREGNSVNGYNVFVTSNMPTVLSDKKGVVFANWSDFVIGSWGGLDLTVDSYSQAIYGKVRIVVNVYFDATFRRTASYALGALK